MEKLPCPAGAFERKIAADILQMIVTLEKYSHKGHSTILARAAKAKCIEELAQIRDALRDELGKVRIDFWVAVAHYAVLTLLVCAAIGATTLIALR